MGLTFQRAVRALERCALPPTRTDQPERAHAFFCFASRARRPWLTLKKPILSALIRPFPVRRVLGPLRVLIPIEP